MFYTICIRRIIEPQINQLQRKFSVDGVDLLQLDTNREKITQNSVSDFKPCGDNEVFGYISEVEIVCKQKLNSL